MRHLIALLAQVFGIMDAIRVPTFSCLQGTSFSRGVKLTWRRLSTCLIRIRVVPFLRVIPASNFPWSRALGRKSHESTRNSQHGVPLITRSTESTRVHPPVLVLANGLDCLFAIDVYSDFGHGRR